MEKTIVAYLVAIFITIVFVKTKFADKWIFSKIRIAYWQLALLQIIGYALLFLAVYTSYITTSMKGTVYHNTPVLEIIFFIFTHAEIIYNDYNRDHFIAPYYYNH